MKPRSQEDWHVVLDAIEWFQRQLREKSPDEVKAWISPPSAQAREAMTDWRNGENMAVQNLARSSDYFGIDGIGQIAMEAIAKNNAAQAREALDHDIAWAKNFLERQDLRLARNPETVDHMRSIVSALRDYRRSLSANVGGVGGAVASQWRDIATAPRDGSRILVGYFDWEGVWRSHEAWWRMPYESAPRKACYWCHGGDSTLLSADVHAGPDGKPLGATHWQPLPAAPVSV